MNPSTQESIRENTHGLAQMFADFMVEMAEEDKHDVLYHTAFSLSKQYEQGHVCLNLKHLANMPWGEESGLTPDVATWRAYLLQTPCVGEAGEHTPMILDGDLLYLQRFWSYESQVADALLDRLQNPVTIDEKALKAGLKRLFLDNHKKLQKDEVDWQKIAAALAVQQRFAVISGGPGTGKTTSLVKVLALLLEQHADMRIRLAAPTGKAAARMMDAIRFAKSHINTDNDIRQRIPEEASTLHRLLGFSPRGYRHHQGNPVLLDCLVIDEASMVDLPMMARVLDALPPQARIILLGDRDQLSSVDAGNVLGDITGHGKSLAYSPSMAKTLAQYTDTDIKHIPQQSESSCIQDGIALLRKSYRFSGLIAALAEQINKGNKEEVLKILHEPSKILYWNAEGELNSILEVAAKQYKHYLACESVEEALESFESCRVLCAVRQGNEGVQSINSEMQQRLLGDMKVGQAVHGMPIMILNNHYELGLFNGDIGLIWKTADGLQACFPDISGAVRTLPIAILPDYEPCWAMTVHKSQGSEFEHVFLILPSQTGEHHVLSRELFYTATTRSKKSFHLYGRAESIEAAVKRRIQRSTGLAKRLGW
ncbi:MAG: exodeoxyribonuclease V subunit alpha [Mariprofundaceae bacterium]|nr:exodeoxyribonuclease V subunit alpha [Mariprofundaceae bacterium]